VSTYETLRPFDVVPIGVVVARRHSPEQTFFIGSRGSHCASPTKIAEVVDALAPS